MATNFPRLFSPIQVGKITLANRIVCTGHATVFEQGGMFTERHLNFYRERARGGAGMIISESASVHPTGVVSLNLYSDDVIPMLSRIADAVHEFDVPILVQATHVGRRAPSPAGILEQVAVAPSAIAAPSLHFGQMMPHELSTEEAEELVTAFGDAARRVRDAGIDGVELTVAFGNIIPQFLAAASNQRTDKYGGSFEKRLTFAYEVIAACRQQLGDDLILGIRVTEDYLDYGLSMADLKRIVPLLEATGSLDYVSVSAGTNYDLDSAANIIPSHYFQPGQFAGLAAEIKSVVEIPVVGAGRMNSPALSERVLAEGQMDMVGMARELIADPHYPRKAREGLLDDIRPCVACNQSCKGHQAAGLPITCIFNPVAGREGEWADLVPAASSKRVLVIGGGPAGMEVARVAAERGHNVTLLERSGRLGGQVNIAASAPGRSEFGEIARYLEGQLRRLKVDVRLNTEATLDLVAREAADAVVIATGSTPHLPQIPGAEGGNVLTARQVLETDVAVGERVVVVDTQGLMQGCDVANYLSKQGKDVEIVTGMPYVGENIQAGVWRHLYEELLRQGVTMSPLTGVSAIGESTVSTFNAVYAEARRVIEGVDTVVFASGGEADDQLFRALQGSVADLHAIGDCVQPRTVEAAVYEGHKLGRLL